MANEECAGLYLRFISQNLCQENEAVTSCLVAKNHCGWQENNQRASRQIDGKLNQSIFFLLKTIT